MEDWQQWQIRADEVAAALNSEVDALQSNFFGESADSTFRSFWPRFRDLKERVRTAPAIKLDDKLQLERRLRGLGSRAYKAQEAAYGQSGERKAQFLSMIEALRARSESIDVPRELRDARRELDGIRTSFDTDSGLVPADRQAVWDAWREANQFVWQRLTDLWSQNETYLRGILDGARGDLERGNAQAARQAVARFYEGLREHEAKQASINGLKAEADAIRRESDNVEERKAATRLPMPQMNAVPAIDTWRSEVERNREAINRLQAEVEELDREFQASGSILEQAMIRGNLVDKRRKLSEIERSTRTLEQRIEQSEESPLIPTA